VNAAVVEPVSDAKFPANREINREFRRIGHLNAILKANTPANSMACNQTPSATQQGTNSTKQGILAQEQGLFSVKYDIVAR
jgi:hypothetical protein